MICLPLFGAFENSVLDEMCYSLFGVFFVTRTRVYYQSQMCHRAIHMLVNNPDAVVKIVPFVHRYSLGFSFLWLLS
jgi:hypothetical protein